MPASCVKPYSVQLDCISAALVFVGSALLRTFMRLLAAVSSLSFQPAEEQFTSSVSSAAELTTSLPDFVPIVVFCDAIYRQYSSNSEPHFVVRTCNDATS